MSELKLAIAAGLFSLAGVIIGAFLTPLTQLYIEKSRDRIAADRAKILVAAELLNAQLIFRSVSKMSQWPSLDNVDAFLPTSGWREHRASLAGKVDEDLWNELVHIYALMEIDRGRFLLFSRGEPRPLAAKEAEGLKRTATDLGRLHRKLGGVGGWLDEDDVFAELKPKMGKITDGFERRLQQLSDDELRKDAVIAEIKDRSKEIGDLNRLIMGDEGKWATEIEEQINQRLQGIAKN